MHELTARLLRQGFERSIAAAANLDTVELDAGRRTEAGAQDICSTSEAAPGDKKKTTPRTPETTYAGR